MKIGFRLCIIKPDTHGRTGAASRLSATMLALFGIFASVGPASATDLSDGRTILNRSLSTYNAMTSYNGRSNTDSILTLASGKPIRQIGTSVEMKFKRPNKLRLDFTTPKGSRVVWSNAAELGVYDPSSRKFWTSQSAPTMETLLPLLFKQASISAYFDPLYGLSKTTVPTSFTDIQLKSKGAYNGHPVYVVTATLVQKLKGTTKTQSSDWTWWIDRNTLLMYKIEQLTRNLHQNYIVIEDGRQVQKSREVSMVIRTVVTDAKPNAQIADSDFQYKPPPGATPRIDPGSSAPGR